MNKKIDQLIDYSCIILVLSFFIIHNIFFVIAGILISLYTINKDSILNLIGKQLINDNKNELESIGIKTEYNKEIETIKIELPQEGTAQTLVETIEDAIETLETSDIKYMYLPELQKLITIDYKNDSDKIFEYRSSFLKDDNHVEI